MDWCRCSEDYTKALAVIDAAVRALDQREGDQ